MTNLEKAIVIYRDDDDGIPTLRAVGGSGHTYPLPAGAMFEPGWILHAFGAMFEHEGTIIVPGPWGSDDWRALATNRGWAPSLGGDGTWTAFRRPGSATVIICRQDLAEGEDRSPFITPGIKPADLARITSGWQETAGTAFRATPGVTGIQMLREMAKGGRQPIWTDPGRGELSTLRGQGDIVWHANPETVPGRGYLHGFDLVAQYLSACTTTLLPWTELLRTDTAVFDPAHAGFWRVRRDSLPAAHWHPEASPMFPTLLNPSRFEPDDDTTWLSTPVMEYLSKSHGSHPEVVGAWLPRKSSRAVIADWARDMFRVRQALRGTDLYSTAKRCGNEAIGLFGRPGGRVHRPDWRWLIMDQARTNLFRKLDRIRHLTSRTPVAVRMDSVWYWSMSESATQAAQDYGLAIGDHLGCWSIVRTVERQKWTGGIPA